MNLQKEARALNAIYQKNIMKACDAIFTLHKESFEDQRSRSLAPSSALDYRQGLEGAMQAMVSAGLIHAYDWSHGIKFEAGGIWHPVGKL